MDSNAHSGFFSYWSNLTNKVGVVVPEFLFRILASMRQWSFIDFAVPIALSSGKMKRPRFGAATGGFGFARPDPVRHVCVCNVADAGLAGITNILFEPLNLLVASRQIEGNLLDIAVLVVGNVPDLQ